MRAFLGGRGLPRDEFALSGIGESSGVPVILLLEDGDVFEAEDYISLGYTNYEAWCVGASGGRGGDATTDVKWHVERSVEVMPDWLWAEEINRVNQHFPSPYTFWGWEHIGATYLVRGLRDTTFNVSAIPPPVGVLEWNITGDSLQYRLTPEGWAWFTNPNRVAEIASFLDPVVQPGGPWIGGGGGGGGLHVVHGLLVDLPASLVAEVGVAGTDGAPGQAKQATPWDPSPVYSPSVYDSWGWLMSQSSWNFRNRFPNGHPTVGAPVEGSPGGPSSFGDICQASGGKGGKPAIKWAGATLQQYADGGAGGIGDSIVSGGGADGATATNALGKDGGWDGEVGSGGGGGRGGKIDTISATEGGRGSLNYADTSVYGARGPRGTYLAAMRNYAGPRPSYTDWLVGAMTIVETLIPVNFNPGSGGGARIPGNRKYGSRAVGYSHDGAVLIRLTKLV